MRLNRFCINLDSPRIEGLISVSDKDLHHQISQVLRLQVGERCLLFDGRGQELLVEITKIDPNVITFSICEEKFFQPKLIKTRLIISILKKENFDWAVLKAAEVGIDIIQPIISDRTVKLGLKFDRLGAIIKEGAEQAGRHFLPRLDEVLDFSIALEKFGRPSPAANCWLDLPENSEQRVTPLLSHPLSSTEEINVWIGPEGGWSQRERDLARETGLTFVGLGETILRAETAAVVASWLIVNKNEK